MVTYRHLSIRHYFLREETFNLQEKNAVRAIEFEVKPHDENAKTNEVLKQWYGTRKETIAPVFTPFPVPALAASLFIYGICAADVSVYCVCSGIRAQIYTASSQLARDDLWRLTSR